MSSWIVLTLRSVFSRGIKLIQDLKRLDHSKLLFFVVTYKCSSCVFPSQEGLPRGWLCRASENAAVCQMVNGNVRISIGWVIVLSMPFFNSDKLYQVVEWFLITFKLHATWEHLSACSLPLTQVPSVVLFIWEKRNEFRKKSYASDPKCWICE